MQIVVISDSHGNISNLKNVCGFAKKINAASIIHCGDWNTVAAIETVLSFGIPLYCVLGNADIDPGVSKKLQVTSKRFEPEILKFSIDGKNIAVIHKFVNPPTGEAGHKSLFINQDIVFYGHTHIQLDSKVEGVRIVNPGALEGNVSFAIYDTTSAKVELIHD